MPEHDQILSLKLAQAYRQLNEAQALVADLEAQLLGDRSAPNTARLSDSRYHHVFDNLLEGVEIIGFDWRYLYVNDAVAVRQRQPKDVLLRSTLLNLYPGIENTRMFACLRTCMEERIPQHCETNFVFPDGATAWFELSIQPIPEGIFILSLNITERKAQERQLRYHASLQDNVSDAVIVTDTAFRIQSWNKAAERIYGWSAEEIIGKTIEDTVRTQFKSDEHRKRFRQAFFEQGYWKGEAVQHRKDGIPFPLLGSITLLKDDQGIPFGIISVIHDITEQKVQERQLRYHASLQDNVSDAVIVTDTAFRIQSWNKAAERIYGWNAEEVINKAAADILHTKYTSATDQEGAIKHLREQGWWQGEVIQQHKDGSNRHILGSVTLVKDEDGLPFGVVSVNHDITERKLAEEALWESQERFRLLVNSVSDYAIYLLNVEGNVTSWSQGAQRINGYTADEILGQNFERFYPPEAILQGKPQELLNIANREGRVVDEGWRVRKDGTQFWAEVAITPLRDKENQLIGYAKVTHDLTERKRAEEALHTILEEEREFQSYLKELHEITIELTQIDILDVFYKRAVELGLERFGFDRLGLLLHDAEHSEVVGTYGTDARGKLMAEHDLRFNLQTLTGLLKRSLERDERFAFDEHTQLFSNLKPIGFGWNVAAVLWNGDQNLGWLAADNAVHHRPASKPLLDILSLYALTIGTLLAQKRVQIALQKSETRYRLLAENVTDVIVKIDPDGTRTFVSPSCYALLGYRPEELLGVSGLDIVHPDDVLKTNASIVQAIKSSKSSFSITQRVRHKAGSYIWVEAMNSIIRDPDTESVVEFISVFRDITEHQKAEEALRVAFEKEKELGELKSRFVSMASHEFRTPLATIFTTADTLSSYRHKMTEDKIEMRLTKIREQVTHLTEIMEDVLELGKLQSGHTDFTPVELDLGALCREIIEDFQDRPDITHQVLYSAEVTTAVLRLDKKLIRQVISNLISNAIKYSPHGKNVTINLTQTNEAVTLSVQDEGIGIPEADLKYLFEPFHRAGNVGTIRGTGLGLAITKEAVELHGGTIVVDSTVGVGTTFIVSIPLI